jgi:hypothetical protein
MKRTEETSDFQVAFNERRDYLLGVGYRLTGEQYEAQSLVNRTEMRAEHLWESDRYDSDQTTRFFFNILVDFHGKDNATVREQLQRKVLSSKSKIEAKADTKAELPRELPGDRLPVEQNATYDIVSSTVSSNFELLLAEDSLAEIFQTPLEQRDTLRDITLNKLLGLKALQAEVTERLDQTVINARVVGATWEQIAQTLEVTNGAVHQKYSPRIKRALAEHSSKESFDDQGK